MSNLLIGYGPLCHHIAEKHGQAVLGGAPTSAAAGADRCAAADWALGEAREGLESLLRDLRLLSGELTHASHLVGRLIEVRRSNPRYRSLWASLTGSDASARGTSDLLDQAMSDCGEASLIAVTALNNLALLHTQTKTLASQQTSLERAILGLASALTSETSDPRSGTTKLQQALRQALDLWAKVDRFQQLAEVVQAETRIVLTTVQDEILPACGANSAHPTAQLALGRHAILRPWTRIEVEPMADALRGVQTRLREARERPDKIASWGKAIGPAVDAVTAADHQFRLAVQGVLGNAAISLDTPLRPRVETRGRQDASMTAGRRHLSRRTRHHARANAGDGGDTATLATAAVIGVAASGSGLSASDGDGGGSSSGGGD
ncbi:hypothetical protein CKO28_02940 [Rhodovibrio sodomensis]|uniref:Nitrate/nitrite sensing protein domain-containing protein n=1 Tax=Rhodovibrio sodomensis TaxID=1088 RepID=A0ABS1D9A8_9PROT|nr:hypothetical protein [Rhodovibrio sodomensis]MBK1666999.1 hypothetical protein [Rhodovibrio sodomensis]